MRGRRRRRNSAGFSACRPDDKTSRDWNARGKIISTAMVAAIGTGEAFERGRDFGAWLRLLLRQYSAGGKTILGRISKRGSR